MIPTWITAGMALAASVGRPLDIVFYQINNSLRYLLRSRCLSITVVICRWDNLKDCFLPKNSYFFLFLFCLVHKKWTMPPFLIILLSVGIVTKIFSVIYKFKKFNLKMAFGYCRLTAEFRRKLQVPNHCKTALNRRFGLKTKSMTYDLLLPKLWNAWPLCQGFWH